MDGRSEREGLRADFPVNGSRKSTTGSICYSATQGSCS
jgi:hypothetical protein